MLLSADMTTVEDEGKDQYPGETFGELFPLCWCHEFEGGRQWYTALGHDPWFYEDPLFVDHLRGGLLWVLEKYVLRAAGFLSPLIPPACEYFTRPIPLAT